MAAIPWNVILNASLPALIEQAGKLFRRSREAGAPAPEIGPATAMPEAVAALAVRVDRLEELEVDQARLLKDSLDELAKVSVLAAGLQRRANVAVGIAMIALAVALAALWMALG